MILSPLLEEKSRVQQELAEQAHFDVQRYMDLTHQIVTELAKKYSITLKYGQIKGGYMTHLKP